MDKLNSFPDMDPAEDWFPFPPTATGPTGFRLKKLEVTNWGTFDSTRGQIHQLLLDGRTALLVGQNGSGKSTLVDALLTLLVQPGVRNYNVAAGAKKRERDERTYVRGACGRSSDEQLGSITDYLRPDDKHYSVLLACFSQADSQEAFTIAQVLQIQGDGELDKTYAFSLGERSIASDLNGLVRGQRIRKQLTERGFQASHSYAEYATWIARQTHMRPQAMDVFNQTVAVKDIQSLNRFVREHMLEPHPWRERIDNLLAHFAQLTQAHQALVRTRRQIELLSPIEVAAIEYQQLAERMQTAQTQVEAVDSFFRQRLVAWLTPRLEHHRQTSEANRQRKIALQREIDALDESQRVLKNEIEQTGGERLRQLPLLLETQQALLLAKRREQHRLRQALLTLGEELIGPIALDQRATFAALPPQLAAVREVLAEQSTHLAERRLQLAQELTEVRTLIQEGQRGLVSRGEQAGNLPAWLRDIRGELARSMQVPESELVFACELMHVRAAEAAWQPAIEMVLRRLALSLLVPEQHYQRVSHFVEHRRLVDSRGRGQRLVYIRVPESQPASTGRAAQAGSLIDKLDFRYRHSTGNLGRMTGWLQGELGRRFDYRCCENVEQFQSASGAALTQQRHVKYGNQQHEKDDRSQATDSSGFVLSGDSSQRIRELHLELESFRERERLIVQGLEQIQADARQLSSRLAAIETALAVPDFDLIDTERHQREIEALELERTAIEAAHDPMRVLRQRLEAAQVRRLAAQQERDQCIATESSLEAANQQGLEIIDRYQRILADRAQSGALQIQRTAFDALDTRWHARLEQLQDVTHFAELQTEVSQTLQDELNQLRQRGEPHHSEIIRCMQRFLSEHPEQRQDLRADWSYLGSFLGLLERLRSEDLPRYEHRFRERLQEKLMQELGVFHAALECERQEILTKLETLNRSLQQVEYNPGSYMRLEPRAVSDREIRDFQAWLRDCLADAFDGDRSADEARFERIERLLRRLREEERWRDKVTDVRSWFDFAARELSSVDGRELSCYEDSAGQSGGEKAKLAFTILVAAIAYQFDLDPNQPQADRLRFVVVDEMFSKVDDRYAEYALQLFEKFGLQLLIVAPLDAKARVTEPYVGCYFHTVKSSQQRSSEVFSLSAVDYQRALSEVRPAARPVNKPR